MVAPYISEVRETWEVSFLFSFLLTIICKKYQSSKKLKIRIFKENIVLFWYFICFDWHFLYSEDEHIYILKYIGIHNWTFCIFAKSIWARNKWKDKNFWNLRETKTPNEVKILLIKNVSLFTWTSYT